MVAEDVLDEAEAFSGWRPLLFAPARADRSQLAEEGAESWTGRPTREDGAIEAIVDRLEDAAAELEDRKSVV